MPAWPRQWDTEQHMSIPPAQLRALLQKSGNRCAFSGCRDLLLDYSDDPTNPVVLSKVAHIVAESPDGPRGRYPMSQEHRNLESNLILLCSKHHDVVDGKPQFYTVERLRQMKEDHEAWVMQATDNADTGRSPREEGQKALWVKERVFSTLFPVTEMPMNVYGCPCNLSEADAELVKRQIQAPKDDTEICPFILRRGMLYAFQNLRYRGGPFRLLVAEGRVEQERSQDWWSDPVKGPWFLSLLNRTLNKLTGRRRLHLDKIHKRYFFQAEKPGECMEIQYKPLNIVSDSKMVVWRPTSKRTGLPRDYWLHRAVNLRFHFTLPCLWYLSVRPEYRVTKDGFAPEDSDRVGSRVTKRKSRMFNYDLLGEVNFWRGFLSDGQPRIILNFGKGQHIIISTSMIEADIEWPGIPEKFARPFKNVEFEEDLFSWARLNNLAYDDVEGDEDDTAEEQEDDE